MINLLALAVLAFPLANSLGHVPLTTAEGQKDAYFVDVLYKAVVRASTSDRWAFTVYNLNCGENGSGEAHFFFKFYVNGELWWDEYNSTSYRTWRCDKGNKLALGYAIKGWDVIQPAANDARIELYWSNSEGLQLEDVISFSINVTIPVSLQHVQASSYLAVYLIICFVALSYYYITWLDSAEGRRQALE